MCVRARTRGDYALRIFSLSPLLFSSRSCPLTYAVRVSSRSDSHAKPPAAKAPAVGALLASQDLGRSHPLPALDAPRRSGGRPPEALLARARMHQDHLVAYQLSLFCNKEGCFVLLHSQVAKAETSSLGRTYVQSQKNTHTAVGRGRLFTLLPFRYFYLSQGGGFYTFSFFSLENG